MREFILIVTAVIIIALVAVVFVIMYINHNKKSGKAHKPTVIYYKERTARGKIRPPKHK